MTLPAIRLMLADVDGTLVTQDKVLTYRRHNPPLGRTLPVRMKFGHRAYETDNPE